MQKKEIAMFEDKFGAHLKEALSEELKTRLNKDTVEIYMSQNNQYRTLENDSEAVSVIIKTGNATKSHVTGYDLNSLPLIVTFTIKERYAQTLLEALTAISDRDNSSFGDIDVDGAITNYKVIYNTPYVSGSAQTIRSVVDGMPATIRAVSIIWLLNVTYSTNALISPPKYILKIKTDESSDEYSIEYWINFSASIAPSYDVNMISGKRFSTQDFLSLSVNYAFVLYKVTDGTSSLQDLLMRDLDEGVLINCDLSLIKVVGGTRKEIPISTYNVNYQFESFGAVLTLSLGR